jgi:chromosome segregation ATPase
MKKAIQITLLAQMALAAGVTIGTSPQKAHAETIVINQNDKTSAQKQLEQAQAKKQKAQERLTAAQTQVEELEKKTGALADKISASGDHAKLTAALKQLQQARTEAVQANSELLALQDSLAQLWADLNSIQAQLPSKQEAILYTEHRLTQVQAAALNNLDNRQAKNDYSEANKNLKYYDEYIELDNANVYICKRRIAQAQEKVDQCSSQLKQAKADLAACKEEDDKQVLTKKVDDLTAQLKDAKKGVADALETQATYTKKKEINDMARARYQKEIADLFAKLDEELSKDSRVQKRKGDYQHAQQELADLQKQEAADQAEIAAKQAALTSQQDKQAAASAKLADEEVAFAELAGKMAQQDSAVKEFLAANEDLQGAHKEMLLAVKDYEQSVQELADAQKQVQEEQAKPAEKTDPEEKQGVEKEDDTDDVSKDIEQEEEDKTDTDQEDEEIDKPDEAKDNNEEIRQTEIKINTSVLVTPQVEKLHAIALVTSKKAPLCNKKGEPAGGLSAGTHWLVSARLVRNGQVYYLVGPDQWLAAGDVRLETKKTGVAEVIVATTKLLTGEGTFANQQLAKGTRWQIFAEKEINGQKCYRLGTDRQWVLASDVSVS